MVRPYALPRAWHTCPSPLNAHRTKETRLLKSSKPYMEARAPGGAFTSETRGLHLLAIPKA